MSGYGSKNSNPNRTDQITDAFVTRMNNMAGDKARTQEFIDNMQNAEERGLRINRIDADGHTGGKKINVNTKGMTTGQVVDVACDAVDLTHGLPAEQKAHLKEGLCRD